MREDATGRVHRYLDGELPREELTAGELRLLETYEDAIGASAAFAREPAPDVAGAVMERVRTERVSAAQRAWQWLWQPRPVQLKPAYPLAALGLVLALAGGVLATGAGTTGPFGASGVAVSDAPGAADDHRRGEVLVQFRLDEPEASSVRLTGTFTGWEAEYELREASPGVWTAVVPLEPGVHEYAFVVDGEEWRPDPAAPTVQDGFGGENSRVAVLLPDGEASIGENDTS